MPIGTSTRPVFFTLPTREKILVPLLFSVPRLRNHSEPRLTMNGTLAQVSTLFRQVGFDHNPFSEVWMYFGRGSPTCPSMAFMSALDSPDTNAPAPRWIFTSKENPEPRMFCPSSPYSFAWSMAICACLCASGYS